MQDGWCLVLQKHHWHAQERHWELQEKIKTGLPMHLYNSRVFVTSFLSSYKEEVTERAWSDCCPSCYDTDVRCVGLQAGDVDVSQGCGVLHCDQSPSVGHVDNVLNNLSTLLSQWWRIPRQVYRVWC